MTQMTMQMNGLCPVCIDAHETLEANYQRALTTAHTAVSRAFQASQAAGERVAWAQGWAVYRPNPGPAFQELAKTQVANAIEGQQRASAGFETARIGLNKLMTQRDATLVEAVLDAVADAEAGKEQADQAAHSLQKEISRA